jgi:hypothetical protein
MSVSTWTEADANQALVIWDQYQQQHDVDSLIGQTAGIDPVTERIWFGSSAKDIWQQMATQAQLRQFLPGIRGSFVDMIGLTPVFFHGGVTL